MSTTTVRRVESLLFCGVMNTYVSFYRWCRLAQVHGFAIPGGDYCALAALLASHGYAVVAPNVYPASDRPGSASEAQKVANWAARVTTAFPNSSLVLAGHSRGGQACAMALLSELRMDASTCGALILVSALLLLDVVEGAPSFCGLGPLQPHLLSCVDEWPSALRDIPVLVVGAQLGATGPCPAAPPGHNFDAVWDGLETFAGWGERPRGMFMVTANDFGHMDYLNDHEDCQGFVTKLSKHVVRNGEAGRAVFRHFVSTIAAEFLNAHVVCENDAQESWLSRVASLQGGGGFVHRVRATAEVLPASEDTGRTRATRAVSPSRSQSSVSSR